MRNRAAFCLFWLLAGACSIAAQVAPSTICASVSGLAGPGTNVLTYVVEPTSLNFGGVAVGSSSSQALCISSEVQAIFTVQSSDPIQFPIQGNQSSTGAIGEYQLETIGFAPQSKGALSAVIQVSSGRGLYSVRASGLGLAPLASCVVASTTGSVGRPYNQTLCATGGSGVYSWQVGSGRLPPGTSLSGNVLSGTPSMLGTYSFSIVVQDTSSPPLTLVVPLTITIYTPLIIDTAVLPDGVVGAAYQEPLTASGGNGVVSWLISSGALPAGLTLTGSLIAGTPRVAGNFTFQVTVSDTEAQPQVASQTFSLTIAQGEIITAVQDAESLTANTNIVPGEFVAIYGAGLAGTTRTWGATDFDNGNLLPVTLDGVAVQFGGFSAAVYYVSPTQLNVQAPSGISGTVTVTATYKGAASNAFSVNVVQYAPTLYFYYAGSKLYASATHANGFLIGDPAISGPAVSKAQPGETIVLYVNGLAPSPGGHIISTPVTYSNPVTVTVGGQTANVIFAGLVAAGQYQVNATLPATLGTGDEPLSIQTQGQSSPAGIYLAVGP